MYEADLSLNFDSRRTGQLGISAVYGSFLAEAASVCLHLNGHKNPVTLYVAGDSSLTTRMKWIDLNDQVDGSWADV